MLTLEFQEFVSRFIVQHGVDILNNPALCKALLKDFAKGEFPDEIRLFLLAVDAKIPLRVRCAAAADVELTARQLIGNLRNQYFLDKDAAFEIVALFFHLLRNFTLTPPAPAYPQNTPEYQRNIPAVLPGNRLNKDDAIRIVNQALNLRITNTDSVFSNINRAADVYWFDPPNMKFNYGFHLLLNDYRLQTIHYFFIPPNAIPNPIDIFYQCPDMIDRSRVKININDSHYIDIMSGTGFSFARFFVRDINYN